MTQRLIIQEISIKKIIFSTTIILILEQVGLKPRYMPTDTIPKNLNVDLNVDLNHSSKGFIIYWLWKSFSPCKQLLSEGCKGYFFSSIRMNLKITLMKIYSVLLRFNDNCKSCKQNPVEANSTCSGSTIHSDWNPPHGELFTVFG